MKPITIVYHGSNVLVFEPDVQFGRAKIDFGRGFYTSASFDQAKRWASRQVSLRKGGEECVAAFAVDAERFAALKVKVFETADSEWLNSIVACRRGNDAFAGFDAVIGPVADDNVYETIRFFETGVYDEAETLKRLKVEKLFNQIVFKTEAAIACCRFIHE